MFKIPMIGEPLLLKENNFFCEHNKLPQVIPTIIYQNLAIRLQEMSRLRKLGERTCRECNEHMCACLWTKYDHKPQPPPLNERTVSKYKPTTMPREYKVGKGWSLRNQILAKVRESLDCQGNQLRDNKQLKSKESVVWLLRPTKKLRESETNIMRPDKINPKPKQKQPTQRIHQKSMPYKYQVKTQSTGSLSSRTMLYNWQARLARQQAATNERLSIQKGTKDYFNKCKKMHEIKLMESQLEKALYSRNNSKKDNLPATQYLSYTKINELNSLEKIFAQQQNDLLSTEDYNSEEYFDEILGTYCLDSVMEPFAEENLLTCNCENCKLKVENIVRQQEASYEDTLQEMASSSSENNATYHVCDSGNICDYMWLKRTDTQIKLSHQTEEDIQIVATQTSNTVAAQESASKTSMNVNFSESCTRMADFESELGQDEASELAKEVMFAKEADIAKHKGGLTKELRSAPEEKEATSVTKIDDNDNHVVAAGTTSSKSKKIHTKKHKHKKLKNTHTKKERAQPSNIKNKNTIETLKSIENVIETESNAKMLVTPDLSDSQIHNIDDSSTDLTSLQPEAMSGRDAYVGLQGTTKQSIKSASYNICYHKPIKFEQNRLFGYYSKKYDEN